MTENDENVLSGIVFDEATEITILELCETCSIETKLVEKMIDEGILEPSGEKGAGRRLPYSSVHRTRTVIHLQRDLGVNLAGAALALELLERIEKLHIQLRRR